MKWIDGLTDTEKTRIYYAKKETWHKRFAWFTTCIGQTPDHHKIYIWLVPMERRGKAYMGYCGVEWSYDYREVQLKINV